MSHAACEAPLKINFEGKGTYGDEVVFVANDWHAGLVPLVVASKYRQYWNTYHNARTITVIHNILHQGSEPATTFPVPRIPTTGTGASSTSTPSTCARTSSTSGWW